MSALTLDLPVDVLARVQAAAQADGDTLAEWVARTIEHRLWLLLPPRERPLKGSAPCRRCDAQAKDMRRGLCGTCARAVRRAQRADPPRPEHACVGCHTIRPLHARGLCTTCYGRAFRQARQFCRGCRSYQQPAAQGLCSVCYQRQRRAAQRVALERVG